MDSLPGGTVTFLFSDIEGSTELLQRLGPAYAEVLAAHHALVRSALDAHAGREVDTAGDGFFAAFGRATDAIAAAADIQRGLAAHTWPSGEVVRVRMGLHTGEPVASAGGYTGLDVHRAARIMGAGWGGQVLVSAATEALVRAALPAGTSLRALGSHRLKDLHEPEPLYQLVVEGLPTDFPPPRAAGSHPHNLPVPPTAMLGRTEEVNQALTHFAEGGRLVTLTGPGGTGKTRLAVEIAARMLAAAGDGDAGLEGGAWFVQLAPITDPALVPPAIADAVGAKERAGRPTLDAVAERIAEQPMLLVLDNFEQVLPAASVVGDLLAACPGLRVLATSRAPLRIRGEQEMPVPPLGLPASAGADAESLSQYTAVRLFIDRATAVRPDFRVDNQNAPAVAEICTRLDGLPLAIELAAARVRLFSPEAMLSRLARPLELLRGGARDLPDRHQTLRATIAWSYDMLPEDQRRLFRRLAVFLGGCTLESAAALSFDEEPDEVAEGVLALLDQSLLRREDGADGEPRFKMLETVREFALGALVDEGEDHSTRGAHAAHFLALAETAEPHLTGRDQARWLDHLDAEQANLRAALGYLEETGRIEEALRMGSALGRFWLVRGHLGEGYRRLLRLVDLSAGTESTSAWVGVRSTAGIMAQEAGGEGDAQLAVRLLEECIAACRANGDRGGLATALGHLGYAYIDGANADRARVLCEEALALQREVGNHRGLAVALQNMALIATLEGRFDDSDALLAESSVERTAHGEQRGIAFVHHWLAYNSLLRGRPADALARAGAGLRLIREVGDAQVEAVLTSDLALALTDLNRAEEALPHAERAMELWGRTGNESGAAYGELTYGLARCGTGDFAGGLAILREAADRMSRSQFKLGGALALNTVGEGHLAAGALDAAHANFQAAYEYTRTINFPRGVADALLGLGAVAAARGADGAAEQFARAAEILAQCGGSLSPRQLRHYGAGLAAAGVEIPGES